MYRKACKYYILVKAKFTSKVISIKTKNKIIAVFQLNYRNKSLKFDRLKFLQTVSQSSRLKYVERLKCLLYKFLFYNINLNSFNVIYVFHTG